MIKRSDVITNVEDAKDTSHDNPPFKGSYKVLTPHMRERGGKLGMNLTRVAPGQTACPFHSHQLEDEVFYVVSGTGIFRYGEQVFAIDPGDCIACPAGTDIAHQFANPAASSEDLVYLCIGNRDPNEVCVYPDSGKIFVRSQATVGVLQETSYEEGEPIPSHILRLTSSRE